MPVEMIRTLAHDLFEALTKERELDFETGIELGRLSAQLGIVIGTATPPIPSEPRSHNNNPTPVEAPARTEVAGNGKPQRKRVRVEKRPMRQAQRLLTAPDGRTVVFDFEELEVSEIAKGRKTPVVVAKLDNRKQVWKRLKEQKKMFRKLARAGVEVKAPAKF